MKKFLIYLGILFLISSCGNVGKVLRNEKITSTDEFLVKKKGPLVLPPNYEEIPEPDTINKQKEDQQSKIKKILRAPKKEDRSLTNSTSVEDSILEKIRK
tara:strand:- start:7 stop:306 length:300 start_codon:yes stop_codon:yes gene_type:complete